MAVISAGIALCIGCVFKIAGATGCHTGGLLKEIRITRRSRVRDARETLIMLAEIAGSAWGVAVDSDSHA